MLESDNSELMMFNLNSESIKSHFDFIIPFHLVRMNQPIQDKTVAQ